MWLNMLGTLEIADENKVITPGAPKLCQVLALLLMKANHVVTFGMITQELWGASPPRSASTTVQTYIYHLRRLLDVEFGPAAADALVTRATGYVLNVDCDKVDALRFERLLKTGERMARDGRPAEAAAVLREASELWRGEVLENVTVGELLGVHVVHLNEARLRALSMRIEADRACGRHRELVPELQVLVRQHPLHEWFHGQLIETLHLAGRRADALAAYQNLRRILHRELGLEPSPEVQRLHQAVLGVASVRSEPDSAVVSPLRATTLGTRGAV